jgi:hypothetical protein
MGQNRYNVPSRLPRRSEGACTTSLALLKLPRREIFPTSRQAVCRAHHVREVATFPLVS